MNVKDIRHDRKYACDQCGLTYINLNTNNQYSNNGYDQYTPIHITILCKGTMRDLYEVCS